MPGFLVVRVEQDSPAARLGLREGDLIVRIAGKDVTRMRDTGKAPDWSRAALTVYRGGRYVRLARE
jgi:S1-C subfamily serine protease